MLDYPKALWAARFTYVGYEPQPVNVDRLRVWLGQFERADRQAVLSLLSHVRYTSERELRNSLARNARSLMRMLRDAGIAPDHIVFMSVAGAGSSSPRLLSHLRNDAHLESLGCEFLDAKDITGIGSLSAQLRDFAIVYVDDFLGTGNQFIDARDEAIQFALGNFSEFFLVAGACEEGYAAVRLKGVEVVASLIHPRTQRPLHPLSSVLPASTKERLVRLSREFGMGDGLGYQSMATMLVNYNNAPDTTPSILRGSIRQTLYSGLFPRTTDLPEDPLEATP